MYHTVRLQEALEDVRKDYFLARMTVPPALTSSHGLLHAKRLAPLTHAAHAYGALVGGPAAAHKGAAAATSSSGASKHALQQALMRLTDPPPPPGCRSGSGRAARAAGVCKCYSGHAHGGADVLHACGRARPRRGCMGCALCR
jgi:hypothetical protein